MTNNDRIEKYVKELARALSPLSEKDRNDIVEEIRAHLDHRDADGKLDDAIKSLGAPAQCARGFLEELKIQAAFADGSTVKSVGTLFELATRRATATVGLFVSSIFFLMAIGFAITAITEIVAPDAAGLWIDPEKNIYALGVVDLDDNSAKEVLGRWLILVAGGLSILSLLIGQFLSRIFIRLMAGRKREMAI
jgi:uncharacterized membrane protein